MAERFPRSLSLLVLLAACTSRPEAPNVEIFPDGPTTQDDLWVEADCSDCKYRWFKDGSLQENLVENTVMAELTAKGEAWSVIVTEQVEGSEGESATVETRIVNAAPEAPEVSIESQQGLQCVVVEEAIDPDEADVLSYSFAWSVNGEDYTGSPLESAYPGDSIAPGETEVNETWTCSATASDGELTSPSAEASFLIEEPEMLPCGESATMVDFTMAGSTGLALCEAEAPVEWKEAQASCDEIGGVLVSVHEEATQKAIESFDTGDLSDFWIGASEGSGPCNKRLCWQPWHEGRFVANGYQNWRGGVPSHITTASASADDFLWDTYPPNTEKLEGFVCEIQSYDCGMGLSQDCPATTCKSLLAHDPQAASGVYWLDPYDDSTEAFQNWCDMERVEGGWTLATTWENVNDSIVNNNSYDPIQPNQHISEDPEEMLTDEHGHVDRAHSFDDILLSYCDPSDWYVRFSLVKPYRWKNDYRDYLAGQKPTSGWDIYYYMVPSGSSVDIWGRDPGEAEVYIGTSDTAFCHAFANTSNTNSTDHRLAWNCELGQGYGGFRSYYMLDGLYGHRVINVPNDDSDFLDEPGGKMCLWVR